MGWLGAAALFMHLFGSGFETVRKINSFLKWIALILGIIQGCTLIVVLLSGSKDAPVEAMFLNLFFAAVNLSAWTLISASEKNQKDGKS